jgi:hypothetical protein
MGRNNGSQIKWAAYALAYALCLFLKITLFNRLPFHGTLPELAPIAAAAVGCFEGSFSGALYGLVIGFFSSAIYYRSGTMMIPVCTVIGMLSGFTTRRQIGKTVLGVVLCGALGILLMEASRVGFYHLFGMNLRQTESIPMDTLLKLAIPEAEYSAAFLLPMFFLYAAIYNRFRTDMEL